MLLPNRNESATSEYRYGYQGSEKDDEMKENGNSYTTYFRQLDPRIGKWLSIDPKATAWESPYVSMGNNPILYNDILGDTVYAFNKKGIIIQKFDNLTINGQHGIVVVKNYHDINTPSDIKSNSKFYAFNDQSGDVQRMEQSIELYGKEAKLLYIKSRKDVNEYLAPLDKNMKDKSILSEAKRDYISQESGSGLLDFWDTYLAPEANLDLGGDDTEWKSVMYEQTDGGPFYIFEGDNSSSYNIMDAGNWLWGAGVSSLNVPYSIAKAGAESNSYSDHGVSDTDEDQNAILHGFGLQELLKSIEQIKDAPQ